MAVLHGREAEGLVLAGVDDVPDTDQRALEKPHHGRQDLLAREAAEAAINSPLLDDSGNSLGDIVEVPFSVVMKDRRGDRIAAYSGAYPFHNNYRSIRMILVPPGNRLKINERRKAYISVENALIPDMVECSWNNSSNPPINFHPTSDNKCKGWLSTEVEKDSYPYRKLMEEGEARGSVYVQLQSTGDFTMLGIAEVKFAVATK